MMRKAIWNVTLKGKKGIDHPHQLLVVACDGSRETLIAIEKRMDANYDEVQFVGLVDTVWTLTLEEANKALPIYATI